MTDSSNSESGDHPYVSVFDLFKIGIGPSSSHSVGPMLAAKEFAHELHTHAQLGGAARIQIDLYGSLALTGRGHGTDASVLMGLEGESPDAVDTATLPLRVAGIRNTHQLTLAAGPSIEYSEPEDMLFHPQVFLPTHPNGMRLRAFASRDSQSPFASATYFSLGGGFILREGRTPNAALLMRDAPYPYRSAADLLRWVGTLNCAISDVARFNERALRSDEQIDAELDHIWAAMQECVERGTRTTGILPGGLRLPRRAPKLLAKLQSSDSDELTDPLRVLDWVDLWALAVNEENAAGGRVVTAPTNGAAGIIPAVLHYYCRFGNSASQPQVRRFLLTAAAIGSLYKQNASISGAEVGCQGEVGVACSMAAGALTEVLGGTPSQVEEAAEIGMEHNLGLTCDPVGGLVQIPCIERNAMGAVKAINASRLALRGEGKHFVSLDRVIRVMKKTGEDMSTRYKETSQGGLAVSVSEC
ncbi:MAG: L-serine ammonia-lyase [Planctomycetales bacterium]|nr:L-serine ammonia-lyase [Planctomycetales bacterium]